MLYNMASQATKGKEKKSDAIWPKSQNWQISVSNWHPIQEQKENLLLVQIH